MPSTMISLPGKLCGVRRESMVELNLAGSARLDQRRDCFFDQLAKQWSEDPGSAASGHIYAVSPDAQLVIEFRQLGLRLKVGETGVVESDFGFHIMTCVD